MAVSKAKKATKKTVSKSAKKVTKKRVAPAKVVKATDNLYSIKVPLLFVMALEALILFCAYLIIMYLK